MGTVTQITDLDSSSSGRFEPPQGRPAGFFSWVFHGMIGGQQMDESMEKMEMAETTGEAELESAG